MTVFRHDPVTLAEMENRAARSAHRWSIAVGAVLIVALLAVLVLR